MAPVSTRAPSISLTQSLRARQRRRIRHQRNPIGRLGLVTSILLSVAVVFVLIPVAYLYLSLMRSMPSLEELPQLLDPPNGWLLQPTRLYDRTRQHILLRLENPAAGERRYLFIDETKPAHFPPSLILATLAVTDPTFWENPGYTLEGWQQATHPTLAQRLVNDLLLWDEPAGWRRNLRERFLASQITSHFGRHKVLEWYLNSARYGRWIYGAEAAARVYFGKSATELNLAEAAMLAAVAEAPALNPIDAPQAALEQQRQVLQTMLAQGVISADEAAQATRFPLQIQPAVETPDNAPAFTNLVLEQLAARFSADRLERGGLSIITTLDYNLQQQADCAAQSQIARLEGDAAAILTQDGKDCQAARLLPTLASLGSTEGQALTGLRATVVVVDPKTGQVHALVGDPSAGLDPAHLPGRAPGTILSPLIYFYAFAHGESPASLQWDTPMQQITQPEYHGPVRARIALVNDYLIPVISTLERYQPDEVWRTASQFGLVSLHPPDSQLQSGEMTLLEGAQAYGVFANEGVLIGLEAEETDSGQNGSLIPWTVLSLEDMVGRVLLRGIPQARPVSSSQLAYLVTHVLSDETARWPSLGHPNSLEIGRPAAAKIGRTSTGQDAWTIGYIPQMVVGVWMGRTDGSTVVSEGSGAGTRAVVSASQSEAGLLPEVTSAVWHAIIQYASRDLPVQSWSVPEDIQRITVCDPSGLLPTEDCPATVSEVFLPGSEPVQGDTLYRSIQINRENGRLATVFTPADLLETRVVMVVPSAASDWARRAGLPTLPDTYDIIRQPKTTSPDVRIDSPEIFTAVRGKVTFTGNAGGDNFDRYSLQVGAGLNPQRWVLIAQDVRKQVQAGILGVWDTSGLSGLYAVQLQVIRQNQIIDLYTLEVTVDNQAPTVKILSPTLDEQFSLVDDNEIIFRASASDNLSLASVIFYIDDQRVMVLQQAPYAVLWQGVPGKHVLRVQAVDQAGNTQEASVTFSVKK